MPNPGRPATGKANVTIRLSPDQWRAVKLEAIEQKCSYSKVIEAALTKLLDARAKGAN